MWQPVTEARTVFIVDDDEAVRDGLAFQLRAAGHRVECFPSAAAFLEAYQPDRRGCLLLDIRMPAISGLDLQRALKARNWSIPTIFITGYATVAVAIAAMKAGAFDFIEKPLREDSLLDSVGGALDQEARCQQAESERGELTSRAALLTPREREILSMVATGEPSKVIARRLGISFRTVELHRSHILEKLRARTTSELIRMALLLDRIDS